MNYTPKNTRYDSIPYNRCGRSGLKLPAISLGLWHNFGGYDVFENGRAIIHKAFDEGITHFDLANNYGPPPGSAEENFGRILSTDLEAYRDELIISTKAGYEMWPGPYGDHGSRKYLIASLDQSLSRMGLDYVDIFYHHRPDPDTPMKETMQALDQIVREGKALYVGLSSYDARQTREANKILNDLGTPCLIHQPSYSMLDRWVEDELLDTLEELGIGCIPFSPLKQGILTDRYLHGIPDDSRAHNPRGFLSKDQITNEIRQKVQELNQMATQREQSLAQMAIAWLLKDQRVTSVLVGASSVSQLENNLGALRNIHFSDEELQGIEEILSR